MANNKVHAKQCCHKGKYVHGVSVTPFATAHLARKHTPSAEASSCNTHSQCHAATRSVLPSAPLPQSTTTRRLCHSGPPHHCQEAHCGYPGTCALCFWMNILMHSGEGAGRCPFFLFGTANVMVMGWRGPLGVTGVGSCKSCRRAMMGICGLWPQHYLELGFPPAKHGS